MLSKETLKTIIETFASLPEYNFVWKFEAEAEALPAALPKNVLIKSFLPQNDLLAHASVKAFITHSGLLSTHEALWYGKPMVVMPFFCDQHLVADRSVRQKVAVKIDFRKLDVNWTSAITEVLENGKYTKQIKKLSTAFRDAPKKPLETAVWWIEYVMRNPKAEHFKTPSLELGWFISGSYDIILTLLILFHVSIYAIYKISNIIAQIFAKTEKLKRG